jgi:hypothetical protein
MILTRLKRPGEALFAHLAATAHLLGLLDLEDGRSGVADGEKQLRVLIEACRAMAPIHGGVSLFLQTSAGSCCLAVLEALRELVHERNE